MEHHFAIADIAAIPELLNRTVPAAANVEDYWRRNDPDHSSRSSKWCAEWASNHELNVDSMREGIVEIGAGSSSITFYPHIAVLSFSARWRGFLTIQAMRDVHRQLAHQVAETLKSPRLIWVADYFGRGFDIAADNGSLNDIHSSLLADWGQPQEAIDCISSKVVAECDHCPPDIWYIESSPYSITNGNVG